MPALAAADRGADADHTLNAARDELDQAAHPEAPGRFGVDAAELALHQADAYLTLGRTEHARTCAETSLTTTTDATPAWAAASLVLAQAEASTAPQDAAQRAHHVLDTVPAARLRATARSRLAALNDRLTGQQHASAGDLTERLRTLPAPIDAHGQATA